MLKSSIYIHKLNLMQSRICVVRQHQFQTSHAERSIAINHNEANHQLIYSQFLWNTLNSPITETQSKQRFTYYAYISVNIAYYSVPLRFLFFASRWRRSAITNLRGRASPQRRITYESRSKVNRYTIVE